MEFERYYEPTSEDLREWAKVSTVQSICIQTEKGLLSKQIPEHRFFECLDERLTQAGFIYDPNAGCSCPDQGEYGHLPACGWV